MLLFLFHFYGLTVYHTHIAHNALYFLGVLAGGIFLFQASFPVGGFVRALCAIRFYSSLCHPRCKCFCWFIVWQWLHNHRTISTALCFHPGDSRICPSTSPHDKLGGAALLLLTWELALWLPKKEGPLYCSPWEDPDLACVTHHTPAPCFSSRRNGHFRFQSCIQASGFFEAVSAQKGSRGEKTALGHQ